MIGLVTALGICGGSWGLWKDDVRQILPKCLLATSRERVMPAVIRSQAMSASSWYINWAGYVLPLHTRQLSSHCRVIRLSCPNRWSLGILTGVPPLGIQQPSGNVKQQRRPAHIFQMLQAEIDILADDSLVLGNRRTNEIRGQLQHRFVIKLRGQPFLRQFDTVALDAWEPDFEVVAFRANGFHVNCLAGRLRRRNDRLGREVERNAQHIRVFDVV